MAIATITLNTSVDKLYVVGALNPYQVSRVQRVNNTAGGKGINVSRIVALLGEDVLAAGLVGGYNGMLFESLITEEKIHKRFTRVAGETRCCINLWDMEQNKSTEYLEPGFEVSAQELERFLQDYAAVVDESEAVCISGSFPAGVTGSYGAELIRIAKEKGKPVLADVSSGQLKEIYQAAPTMLKPNTDEIVQLFDLNPDNRKELVQATQEMHRNDVAIAAISLGKDGVILTCDEGTFHVLPPRVEVKNTVGSGDAMIGGFAVGLARKSTIEQTMRLACAAATANTLTMSTGSFVQEDFERIFPLVTIEQPDQQEKRMNEYD